MEITKEEKLLLLQLARNSISSIFKETPIPEANYKLYPVFKLEAGAFVTLTIEGNLRGCIGYVTSEKTLYETVIQAARQAAMNDPRFPELTEGELDLIAIDISVLSPPFKMKSYNEIVVGKHGLIVTDGMHRGLLLPQVPVEHKLNRDQYLSALCQKAGLPSNKWREKLLNIEMFTANVFSEKSLEEKNDSN